MTKLEDIVGSTSPRTAPLPPDLGPIAPTPDVKPQPKRKLHVTPKKIVLGVVGLVLLVGLVLGIWFGGAIISNLGKIFSKKGNSVFGLLSNTKLKGEDAGRVNILLAGDSADDPGHGGANLTDSIMLLSIDTKNHTAFTLSIPRDLWVNVPGNGYEKINAANADGGMPLLEQVLDKDLGITIDYYALVNYSAFRDAVNAVGGIDVTIASTDSRGLYDANITKAEGGPLRLANGVRHLDGQTALNLARARGDSLKPSYGFPRSDFDRTEHQREMLVALAKKAGTTGVLTNPVKVTQLLGAAGNNVQTDFQTNEIRSLVSIVKSVDLANAQSLSFVDNGQDLITDYAAPDGESALVPKAGPSDFSAIQAYLRKMMTNDPVVKEAANVVVLNGSGVQGLAKKDGDLLTSKGLNVLVTDNAPSGYTTTTIIDNSAGKKPATKTALAKQFSGSTTATNVALTKTYPSADFIIVLGSDQAPSSSSGP